VMSTEVIIVMKARTFGRHVRESLKSLGRNSWMTFASVSAVTVTLLLVGVFIVIMMNLNKLADDIENDVEIKVIVDLAADESTVGVLEEQIRSTDGVSEVKFSTNTEELDNMIKGLGDEFNLFKQDNPLRHAFYVKASNPQETINVAKKIETYDYIYEVIYGEGKVERLFQVLNVSRNVGLVLILALLFTAMFLISNTIRITIVARRREIEIMKLVGATNNFVRIPFLIEGVWLGILGSIIPMAIISFAYFNLFELLQPKLQGNLFKLIEVAPFIYQLNGLILFMGVFIGVWGSFMSVRKFLKV
jgi:cell division transport system permease protein